MFRKLSMEPILLPTYLAALPLGRGFKRVFFMTAHSLTYFEPVIPSSSASSTATPSTVPTSSEQKTASAEREHERSVHLRTQFLRRVAHDIASPAGVTTTVIDELAQVAKERPELATMARRGLRRLLRLSEILALAADLEAGPADIETTREDMAKLAKDALDQAVLIDGRRDVTVTLSIVDPSETKKTFAMADRRLLLTSLREIVGNAIRFASGNVRVSVKEEGSQHALVTVEDDGPGMPDEVKTTLGQRFLPRSTTRGLGLSLSIADEIIAAHGGTLTIDSSTLPVGRRGVPGAAVTVSLPLVQA